VFNTSYRVLWLANIFNGALSGATGVKLGMALGAGQPQRYATMTPRTQGSPQYATSTPLRGS